MFVSSTYKITGLHYTYGCATKCSLCLLALPIKSLDYTVLTGLKAGVWLTLSSKKKATIRFAKNQPVFLKSFTPYWAPKDIKISSIIEEFFARVKQVLLSWVSIQRCKEHNYNIQTLSSNSSRVAGISQVIIMKHITINRLQMVSITKLYLTLRKKLLFASVVLPIEKSQESSHDIRYNRGNTNRFHESYALPIKANVME